MGSTLTDLQAFSALPAPITRPPERGSGAPTLPVAKTQDEGYRPAFGAGRGADSLVEAFEAITYRAEEVSLAYRFSQAAARSGEGGDATAQAGQLRFDFFFESRTEELALFRERTAAVGASGGTGARFAAVAGEVAAKFELSITITGASLEGFAGAAEGASSAEEIFQRLVAFAEKVLGESEALFEQIFSLLGGGPAKADGDFVDRFLQGIDEVLRQAGQLGGPGEGGNTRSVNAFGVQLEFSFSISAEASAVSAEVQQSDPIVLDLNGNGFDLTSYRDGARFDILGNGQRQNTAFVTGGDAFLVLDRNGNGLIDSGKELFGDQNGASNGFEELRKLDSNGDGLIDARDAAFGQLQLWRDNGNGRTEGGELLTLRDAGIAAIELNYTNTDFRAAGDNRIAQLAAFRRSDGTRGLAGDALLNYTV
jgi:hypothetical protein